MYGLLVSSLIPFHLLVASLFSSDMIVLLLSFMNLMNGLNGCLGRVSPDCTKEVGVVVSAVLFSLSVIDRRPFRRWIIAERFVLDIAIVRRWWWCSSFTEYQQPSFLVLFILPRVPETRKVGNPLLKTSLFPTTVKSSEVGSRLDIFSLKHESSIFRSVIRPCSRFLHDGTGYALYCLSHGELAWHFQNHIQGWMSDLNMLLSCFREKMSVHGKM